MVQIVIPTTQLYPQCNAPHTVLLSKHPSSSTSPQKTTIPTSEAGSANRSHQNQQPMDWILVELQGSLEAEVPDMAGLEMGTMEVSSTGTPFIIIGHNKLEGKIVTLPKPFALIRKRTTPHSAPSSQSYANKNDLAGDLNMSMATDSQQSLPPPIANPLMDMDLEYELDFGDEEKEVKHGEKMGGSQQLDVWDDRIQGEDGSNKHGGRNPETSAIIPPEYEVVSVIRYKYLFNTRPKHIIGEKHQGLSTLKRNRK
ncbi:Chromosome transmission fidelity protein 8 [Quaeritorhiza haematococci]|nr:Chromosome transmission fidelity protein 8 [Quaeritorhiza haematococci]